MSTPTRIDAPYNFVPLNQHIVEAEWYPQVSHDLPFKDGFSGEITFELTNTTPLLVGGVQQRATKESPGKVEFYKTPTGHYAIPGSSLRGMIRSVYEIATYSQMRLLDDKRYGLRDISGGRIRSSYADKVGSTMKSDGTLSSMMKAGFLSRNNNNQWVITPHSMVHIYHDVIDEAFDTQLRKLIDKADKGKLSVAEKYKGILAKIGSNPISFSIQREDVSDRQGKFIGQREIAVNLQRGSISGGRLVLTGQPSKMKKRDFIFYNPSKETIVVPPNVWRDFLFIHDADEKDTVDEKTGQKKLPATPFGYWQEQLNQGKDMPVFYTGTGESLKIGLAYMPKLAGDFSTYDLLEHTNNDHLNDDIFDMTRTLFGYIGDKPDQTLKSRVFFEAAIAKETPKLAQPSEPTILNSPKASYFPNYLKQKGQDKGKLPETNSQYATYMKHNTEPKPEIRGFKRYPARPVQSVKVQALDDEQKTNKAVQVVLHPLEENSRFVGKIKLHNTKPEEIGALLWSLQFGKEINENLHHRLGMGKSFGYGQVQFKNIVCNLTANNPAITVTPKISDFIEQFSQYMDKNLEKSLKKRWINSDAILTLVSMADPKQASTFNGQLAHMKLTMSDNPFNEAKKEGLVLAEYPKAQPQSVSIATKSNQWVDASIEFQAGSGIITARLNGKSATSKDKNLLEKVPNVNRQLTGKNKKPVKTTVTVEEKGSQFTIIDMADIPS